MQIVSETVFENILAHSSKILSKKLLKHSCLTDTAMGP